MTRLRVSCWLALASAGLGLLVSSAIGHAQHAGHARHPAQGGPYAGQDVREVASFSPTDLAALKAGHGWGLALPAELNGFPGPLHVLELAEKLQLTIEQRGRVTEIFNRMREEAIAAGQAFIAAEAALDQAFRSGTINRAILAARLVEASNARARLRAAHLAAHLETTPILNPHQRHVYQFERGYGGPFSEKHDQGHRGPEKP